ncbi:hypothetical protein KJ853_02765 [Patescibacteria group bacterium]|nr:hypothetical protein [Patescibacteria group bacterium]
MAEIFTLYPGKEEFCLLALHGDEWPAREVCLRARQALRCGAVVFNGKKRLVIFSSTPENGSPERIFEFDPNRIWTHQLAKDISYGLYLDFRSKVFWPIREFFEKFKAVISLHNNGKPKFSVRSFIDGDLKEFARAYVLANPQGERDFFIVTKEEDFKNLSSGGFSVVWQNPGVPKDGSLSAWFANKKRFISIETRTRPLNSADPRETEKIQLQMLAAALRSIKPRRRT